MAANFAALLRAHGREVARLEGDQAAEFLRLLKELRDRLAGRMGAMPQEGSLDAFRLHQVMGEAEAGIRALEAKAGGLYGKAEVDAADLAASHLTEEVDRLGRAFDKTPIVVRVDAAAALADPAQRLLANHFDSSVKRYGLETLNAVRREVFVSLRAGDSFRDAVGRVSSATFGPASRSNADRLVRTEVAQAYGSAQAGSLKQAAKQVPGLKKTWWHTGQYPCPVCIPLHGTQRNVSGDGSTWTIRQGKRTREVAHAPGHPRCVCRVVAMKATWKAAMDRLGYMNAPQKKAA